MKTVHFATTNKDKILIAKTTCDEAGITLNTVTLDIDEIQGEDSELIVRDKAKRAFEQFGRPIVVSDDSWDIRALNGFPGPYMKSMNRWFEPEDFLRLMSGIKDRRITLHQYLAFTDGAMIKIFSNDFLGNVVMKPRGESADVPAAAVIELEADKGMTIAEVFEQGEEAIISRFENKQDVWRQFIDWYIKQK